MRVNVSIVIPVFRRTAWIGLCCEALGKQDYTGNYEVIVVDDGSPNEAEVAEAVAGASLHLRVPLKSVRYTNRGPAAARNSGTCLAAGEIICFIDDDSIPDPGWLSSITAPFSSPLVAIASGRTCSFDRENPLTLLLEHSVYAGKSFATCNIAYRRSAFEALGGFDETFPEPSWEDNDLGLRARWGGMQHEYIEKAVVYHPHEATIDEYRDKCLLNGRGAAVFSCKWLRTKPLWGIATPVIMSRRLLLGLLPGTWFSDRPNMNYLKFLWSLYSLKGFVAACKGAKRG